MKNKIYFAALLVFALPISCTKKTEKPPDAPKYEGIEIPSTIKNELKVGEGATANLGKTVKVHFTGWIYDPAQPGNRGPKFTESKDTDAPTTVNLGDGDLVKGWEQGIVGMQEGGKRQLIIPASEAYGDKGAGSNVPPNAILLIEITLVKVE
jgi:FKBP-type peptidyl-prolyl cis-trans isomerase FkpA